MANFFSKEPCVPEKTFSQKDGEELTEFEKYKLISTEKCPDCEGTILGGAHGGAARNIKCGSCNAEFNISPIFNELPTKKGVKMPIIAQRISNRKTPLPTT